MAIIDQRGDNSHSLWHKINSLYELPAAVKEASFDRRAALDEAPNANMFADVQQQQFPMHNPAALLTSALYAIEQRGSFEPVKFATVLGRLRDAAEFFGLSSELTTFQKRAEDLAATDNIVYPDSDFAIVHVQDGVKQRYMRLSNPDEIKVAAAWFQQYQDEFAFADRVKIATRVLAKADEHQVKFGADMSNFLETRAANGMCSASAAADFVIGRLDRVQSRLPREERDEIMKLATVMRENPGNAHRPHMLVKLAEQMDNFDRTYGLVQEYRNGLPRPEDVLFALTKTALDAHLAEHIHLTSGNIYTKQALTRLTHTQLADHMGTEFADEVTSGVFADAEKLAEILPTLPRGDAERFDMLVQAAGGAAAFQKSASESIGLTHEELAAYAALYDTANS